MSDNLLESFPYYALHRMKDDLKKVDLSRNRITRLLDDQETENVRYTIRTENARDQNKRNIIKNPFSIFKQLQKVDLSANGMTLFPTELNALVALKELNLMNNNIGVVPQSFFGSYVRNTLRSLVLNQNPLRELDPSVE